MFIHRSKYDELQTNALSLLSDLEEALLTVGQFEEAYHELRMWLRSAWDQLQNPEPIPGQSQIVATIAAKHKVRVHVFINHLFVSIHHLSICLSFIYLHLSVYPHLSTSLSIYLSIYLSLTIYHLSIYLSLL